MMFNFDDYKSFWYKLFDTSKRPKKIYTFIVFLVLFFSVIYGFVIPFRKVMLIFLITGLLVALFSIAFNLFTKDVAYYGRIFLSKRKKKETVRDIK